MEIRHYVNYGKLRRICNLEAGDAFMYQNRYYMVVQPLSANAAAKDLILIDTGTHAFIHPSTTVEFLPNAVFVPDEVIRD